MNVNDEKVEVTVNELKELQREYGPLLYFIDMTERNVMITREEYRKTPSKYNLICNLCGFNKLHYEAEMLTKIFIGDK